MFLAGAHGAKVDFHAMAGRRHFRRVRVETVFARNDDRHAAFALGHTAAAHPYRRLAPGAAVLLCVELGAGHSKAA